MGKAVSLRAEQTSKGLGANIKTKYVEMLQRFCGADDIFPASGLKLALAY